MKTSFILLLISLCWAQASQPQPSFAQRLLGLINGQTGTEEHLLHLEPVGSYLVSADGQRLAGEAYLSFAVSNGGVPVTEDGSVQVEAALYHLPESDMEGKVEALLTTLKPLETRTYTAELVGDEFVVDPLDISAVEAFDWQTSG